MQQEPGFVQKAETAVSTAAGYEVPEGKGEFLNRNSILLLIGQGTSLIGDGFYALTVNLWLLAFLVGSAKTTAAAHAGALTLAAATTITIAVQYVAQFLIYPFEGVFVDRWNRKVVMVTTNVAQAVFALLPLAAYYGSRDLFLPAIYITYFALTVLQGFFRSAELGAVQVIVSKRRAPQTISLFQTLVAVGTILGALYSGTFFTSYGAVVAISFNALSFLISALFVFFMRVPRPALHPYAYRKTASDQPAEGDKGLRTVLSELGVGTRFIFTAPPLMGLIILLVVAQIGVGALGGLYGGFFVLNLHGDPVKDANLFNLLPAAVGTGALLGALLAGLIGRFLSLKLMSALSVILIGLGLFVLGLQSTLFVGLAVFGVVGIFQGIFVVAYTALITQSSPQTMIGRVNAAINSIIALSSIIATFGVALIVNYYNPLTNPRSPFATDPSGLLTNVFIIAATFITLGGAIGLVIFLRARSKPEEGTAPLTAEAAGELTN